MARFVLLAAAVLLASVPPLEADADARDSDTTVAPDDGSAARGLDTSLTAFAAQSDGNGKGKGNAAPLAISIDAGIRFSLLALRGPVDGDALIDPVSGETRPGPNMINLGGLSFQGKAVITGQPLRPIRVELPTQVVLHSPDGSQARLTEFTTDLPGVALLDADGRLEFSFGAKLDSHNATGGKFRGRIPIRVDYF